MRALAILAAVAAIQAAPAPFALPAPTGPHAVGTATWRLADPSRRETISGSSTAGEPRQVEVFAWYPAAGPRRAEPAPYLREGLVEVRTFAKVLRAQESVFDGLERVVTHAELDAAIVAEPRTLPLLVFSHGYTGIPSSYTALLEDLASHGYVVLSVVHPYESTAATLADGRVVTMLDSAGLPAASIRAVFDEWRSEDEKMAEVTRTPDVAAQLNVLRGYISSVPRTNEVVRRWVDDTKLVLDRLPARIASRVDAGRVGAFGHSMGGVVSGQFCLDDRRCRAGLNLDGIPQSGDMLDRTMPQPFLMVYSARPGRLGASDAIYRRAARRYYRVDVPDTRHLDFTDMVYWGGPLTAPAIRGAMPAPQAIAVTRAIVRGFFDQELRGRTRALSAGLARFPDVSLKTVPRSN